MDYKMFLLVLLLSTTVNCQRIIEAIDTAYIESVVDNEECDRQIQYIKTNVLLGMQFADAGIRIPRGVLVGGTTDLGNYHQCLGIEHSVDDMNIQGKFCSIRVPGNQSIEFPSFENPFDRWTGPFNPSSYYVDEETSSNVDRFNLRRAEMLAFSGDMDALDEYYDRTGVSNPLAGSTFSLAVCVPRPCSTQQAITSLLFNVSAVGFQYTDSFCRLPNDKPWSGADIAAVVVFSLIGILTLLSTCYDLVHRFFLKTDNKAMNPVYQSFSIYTNCQRLTTFSTNASSMQCIDGIRTLAMVWVIIGHSFVTEPFIANPLDSFSWMMSADALWITTATATVDTFFTLSGILLVYTTAGKMTGSMLLKNLHWFYMTRIVRITPLLATTILLQASYLNHMADGPFWQTVANRANMCRRYWYYTLFHLQNLFNKRTMCSGHAWYIAIDIQLYTVSPLVLYWVLTGRKRNAWSSLIIALLAILAASTTYNFIMSLQAGVIVPSRGEDSVDYHPYYYNFPLTRAAPFFVGLIAGYVLHLCRGKKVALPWIVAILFWLISFGIIGGIFYFKYRIMQLDWDNQFMDNFMNSFMRPAWACVISWLIFACVHGYSGPINWFLSWDVWRLPARLTYGMYLLHYPFMFSINGTMMTPIHFTVGGFTFKFLSYLVLSIALSFFFTVLVDSPISALYKQLMVAVQQSQKAKKEALAAKEENGIKEGNSTKEGASDNVEKSNDDIDKVKEVKNAIPS